MSGIIAIYFLANVVGPAAMEISEIRKGDIGKQVVVNGTVISARITGGNLFIKMTDYKGNITVVMFGSDQELSPGDNITVTGQVNTYKSTLEVIAKTVIEWK